MFDAARAALLVASGALADLNIGRTHNGLIWAFSLHLVKTGCVHKGDFYGTARDARKHRILVPFSLFHFFRI